MTWACILLSMMTQTTYMTKADIINAGIGAHVFCTVRACSGWYVIRAIRPRDGYIKIDGFNTWNPPHNFTTAPSDAGAV